MSLDIHIQLRDPSQQTVRGLFTFGPSGPIAIEGMQKLVNRWLKVFLTPRGSHPWRRSEGTEFYQLIGGNVESLRGSEALVIEAIDDANEQVVSQDRAEPTRPATERLQSAALLRFVEVPPAGIEFWVEFHALSGDVARIVLPYATA